MTEWSIEPIEDMPDRAYKATSTGLTGAVRSLADGQALFVPAREGESVLKCGSRITSTAYRAHAHARLDYVRGGVWIYKDGAKP